MRRRRYRGRRSAGRSGGGKKMMLCMMLLAMVGIGLFSWNEKAVDRAIPQTGAEVGSVSQENTPSEAVSKTAPSRGGEQSRLETAAASGNSVAEKAGSSGNAADQLDLPDDDDSSCDPSVFQQMMGAVFPAIGASGQNGTKVAEAPSDQNVQNEVKKTQEAAAELQKQLEGQKAAEAAEAAKKAEAEKKQQPAIVDTQTQLTPQVIIYHTHATESYLPVDEGNFHSLGEAGTVREVGDVMTAALQAKGIGVIHDKTIHDSPSYNKSYGRSLETVKRLIAQNPSVKIVIDLHRDAAGYAGGAVKTVSINGQEAAKFSLVVGKGNPNYQKLNALANQVVSQTNALHPGLANRVIPKEYKYNQYVSDHHLLLEIGNNQNTIDQVKVTGQYFADTLEALLKNMQ